MPGDSGLNDMQMADWSNISLTTLHQPFDAILRSAVDLICETLADAARLPEARILPCRLV